MHGLFGGTNPALIWAIMAIIMAVAEIVVPGVFLIWLALAAGLVAGLTLLIPLAEPFQLLAFAAFSLLTLSGGRLWYLARPVEPQDPLLNDKAARMIGRKVVVVDAIEHGSGRVRVDDGTWPANGPDAAIGTPMIVTDVAGSTLVVTHAPLQIG